MKNRSKNRRHQTAYEAPELEGEFLNESADSMLSVSDSLGNLTSSTVNEIDASLLEEFNEDQGTLHSRPLESSRTASKRMGASRSSGMYVSARAALDEKKARAARESFDEDELDLQNRSTLAAHAIKASVGRVTTKVQDIVEPLADDVGSTLQKVYRGAQSQGQKLNEAAKSRPYLLVLGAVVAGVALSRIFASSSSDKR